MAHPGSAYAAPRPPRGGGIALMERMAEKLALLSAVPLRWDMGIDRLSKATLAYMTLFWLLMSWWGNVHLSFSMFGGLRVQSGNDASLKSYALLVWLPLAVWQHVRWICKEKRGTEPHTWWAGDGHWYSFIPLPDKYIDMLIDPAVAFLAGLLLSRLGYEVLGFWICVSACALFVSEKIRYSEVRKRQRELGNMDKEARWDATYIREKPKGGQGNAGAGVAVITTGNDAEIQAQLERRRMQKLMENPEGGDNEIR
jgi:hypothetical protein